MHSAASTEARPKLETNVAFSRDFAFVIATQFVVGLSISAYSILPSVVVRHHRGTAHDAGLATALLAFGALVSAPFAGVWLDRIGRRTMILAACAAATVAALGFAIFLDVPSIARPLLVLSGASFVIVVNGVSALVADLAPPEALGRAVGWQGAATMIAGAIAPTLAEHAAPTYGFHAPFYAAAALTAIATAMAYRLPKDTPVASSTSADGVVVRASLGTSLRALAPLLVVSFLVGSVYTAIATFQQPHVIAQGASSVRAYFVGFSGGALFMRLGFGSLPDRLGLARATRCAIALYALVAFAFAAIDPATLVFGGVAHGIAHGVFYPSLVALAFRSVGPRARGVAAALTNGAFNGGSAIAGFAFGSLADATSTANVFLASGVCAAAAFAFVRAPKEANG